MARKAIQGITIEIGGDTSKLQTALRGVESKLKDTQNALKDVDRLLKIDPGNVELLTQKQKLLGESIEGTKDKLQTLKDAAEQADRQLADGSMSQAQFDALQREIIETENNLKSLTAQMKDFGSVSAQQLAAAGEKVKDVGDKISKVGEGMTKAVTGPIVAAGAAATAAWKDVDDGLDIIVKKTGASGDALADMQDRAKNLATSIPTDFATAGAAVGEVNTRFGLTGDALEDLSGKFIKFSKLNDTDVSSSIDSVQAAMAAFGISGDKAGNVLDIINKAAQDTGVDVNRLTGDLTANAAALQEMGFRINGATGFLANLNKSGLDSSTVLTGMKKALQNATKEGKPMQQALFELQGSIAGAKSDTEAMQAATELFGAKAAPALVKAIRDGRLSFDEMANAVKDTGDSVGRTFDEMESPMDGFKTAMNELKLVGADVIESAAPLIKQLAKDIKTTLANIRAAWEGLSPMQRETIIKIAAIVAAVGPLLLIIGKVVSAVGGIMALAPQIAAAIAAVKGVLAGLFAVMAANPVVLVIAGIAALIAALKLLWDKCQSFRDFVYTLIVRFEQAWEAIKAGTIAAWEGITGFLGEVWSGIMDKAADVWGGIKDTVSGVTDAISDTFREKWDGIKDAYEAHGGGLKGIAAATWEAIKGYFSFGFDVINKLTGGKLDGIKKAFTDAWENVKNTVKGAIDKIKSFFDFEWELPKIKLPHFSIQGSFSLTPPSVPHLAVDWYKKAMNDGMILTSPTILPAANGTLRGFGDAGPEAVVGVDSLRGMVADAVARALPRGGGPKNLTIILKLGRTELGRAIYELNGEETQRVGVKLTDRRG